MSDSRPVPRTGARMLILDPDDRLLLIEERGGGARPWHHWLTPGGGVEPGEALADAATREVFEETGVRIRVDEDATPFLRTRREWSWDGTTYDQIDHFFAVRVAAPFEVSAAALTDMEQETVIGDRWWTLEELRSSDAVFNPPDVADVVERLLAARLPAPIGRTAGRTLVLDPDGAVLMIQAQQTVSGGETNWITPGGGLEAGETPAQAAVRELFEETGIVAVLPEAAEPVFVERAVFSFADRLYDQTDVYFAVRLPDRPQLVDAGLTDYERATTLDVRWWTPGEIRASDGTFWPVGLADLVETLDGSA